jgi:hypothetical protein
MGRTRLRLSRLPCGAGFRLAFVIVSHAGQGARHVGSAGTAGEAAASGGEDA